MTIETLHGLRMERLAFPARSPALETLVDDREERLALDAIRALTATVSNNPWDYVRAPFACPAVSRFSDGAYGVLSAANSLVTAIRESAYHLTRIYTDGRAPAMETRRLHLGLRLAGAVVDARRRTDPRIDQAIYDPEAYAVAQAFGAKARSRARGLHYDSVRNSKGGHCVCAFAPDLVRHARITSTCAFVWDGRQFVEEHDIRML
ncbi:MAG: RES family NAD+ phosphorylase [bacterium]|nr:RES family NAD+ phosphorylase [bacterium]